MSRKLVFAACITISVFSIFGCSPLEKQAYNVIVYSNAFLKSMKAQHPECTTSQTPLCQKLSQAVAAKDLLIDATEQYCAGPDFNAGGKCNPPAKGTPAAQQAAAKLQSALASYEQIETDLKGAAGK